MIQIAGKMLGDSYELVSFKYLTKQFRAEHKSYLSSSIQRQKLELFTQSAAQVDERRYYYKTTK